MNIWDTVKDFLSTRGVQLGARWILTYAIMPLATYLGIKLGDDQAAQAAVILATILVAGAVNLIERFAHKTQQQDVIGRAVDMVVQRAADATPAAMPIRAFDKVPIATIVTAAQSVKAETAVLGKLPAKAD